MSVEYYTWIDLREDGGYTLAENIYGDESERILFLVMLCEVVQENLALKNAYFFVAFNFK